MSLNNIVLFTQRVEIIESYNERRDCADQRIGELINVCGFLSVPVPNRVNIAEKMVVDLLPEGIILTGGNSLVKYGGNAPERDATDKKMIELSIHNHIPLYGFCRGMQSILDYFGNNLVEVSGHVAVRHSIRGKDEALEVNSYHNQGCKDVSLNELDVIMRSTDGVIEKVRHKSLPIVGTMWHPEREAPFRKVDLDMIIDLFGGSKR